VLSNLEYRINFISDAILQPLAHAAIELLLWLAVFRTLGRNEIGGFTLDSYLAYALWAPFFARTAANWMYEFRMCAEVEYGTINTILTRPITFFEYYWSQFLSYKIMTIITSLWVPIVACAYFNLPVKMEMLPWALILMLYYLLFVYLMSYLVCCFAFFMTKTASITMAKNLTLWTLSGELVPFDIAPEPYKSILMNLPFCHGVYTPVGLITGRLGLEHFQRGMISTTYGILFLGAVCFLLWRRGVRIYTGTGA